MSGSRDGDQWTTPDGTTHTVNSTSDPRVGEGGYYYNQHGPDGHATAVYNADGTLADVPANSDWTDVPRQD